MSYFNAIRAISICLILLVSTVVATDNIFTDSFVARVPRLEIDKTSLQFGPVRLGERSTIHRVQITNAGYADLILRGLDVDGAFQGDLSSCPELLRPQQSCKLEAYFSPNSVGEAVGNFSLYSSDPAGPKRLSLTGTALQNSGILTLDLSDASALIQESDVGQSESSSGFRAKRAASSSKLWKSTSNGLETVEIRDGSGNPVDFVDFTTENTWTIDNKLTALYVTSGSKKLSLLVPSETGLAYNVSGLLDMGVWSSFDRSYASDTAYDLMRSFVQPVWTKTNQLYFFTLPLPSQLARIDFSPDSSFPTYEIFPSSQIEQVSGFTASHDGEKLIYKGDTESGIPVIRLIRTSDGALFNLRSGLDGTIDPAFFRGLDGNIFLLSERPDVNEEFEACEVRRVDFDSQLEPLTTFLGKMKVQRANGQIEDLGGCSPFLNGQNNFGPIGGKLFIGIDGPTLEIDLANLMFIEHNIFPNFSGIKRVATRNYIWSFGFDNFGLSKIGRYDPVSRASVELEFPADLELIDFEPQGTDKVAFKARQLPNLSLVIGEATLDGTTTVFEIFDAISSDKVTIRPLIPSDFIYIDGDGEDWSAALRTLDSAPESGPAGHDLLGYSETSTPERYFGKIDFSGEFHVGGVNEILIPPYTVTVSNDGVSISGDQVIDFPDTAAAGTRSAIGSVYEFSIPVNLLQGSELKAIKVSRFAVENEEGNQTISLVDETLEQ